MSCIDCMGSCEVLRDCRRCREAAQASEVHRLKCRIIELEAVLREVVEASDPPSESDLPLIEAHERARASLAKGPAR